MTDKPENPQAFPSIVEETNRFGDVDKNTIYGMTLRDYFAGQALPALIAGVVSEDDVLKVPKAVYLLADAMLKAREAE